jgi:tetratricopeptide (TPR) repeat protein
MNYSRLALALCCLTIVTTLPAGASNLPSPPKLTTATPQQMTPRAGSANEASNPTLQSAQQLNQQGAELLAAGKPEQALTNWQQAQKLYTQAQDPQGIIGTKINQAQALQSLGFYRQALLNLQAVNTTLQQQPDSDLKMQGLLGLGNSLRALRILEQKTTTASQSITLGSKETLIQL